MTDAYLVVVLLVMLILGGLVGSGLTLLALKRQGRLDSGSEPKHRSDKVSGGISQHVLGKLERLIPRYESLDERLDFVEQLMLERPIGRESKLERRSP